MLNCLPVESKITFARYRIYYSCDQRLFNLSARHAFRSEISHKNNRKYELALNFQKLNKNKLIKK